MSDFGRKRSFLTETETELGETHSENVEEKKAWIENCK